MPEIAPQIAAESYEALLGRFDLSLDPERSTVEEATQPLDRTKAALKFLGILQQFTGLDTEADADPFKTPDTRRVSLPLEDGTEVKIMGTLAMRSDDRTHPAAASVTLFHKSADDRFFGRSRGFVYRGHKDTARVEKDVDDKRWSILDGQVVNLGKLLDFASRYPSY